MPDPTYIGNFPKGLIKDRLPFNIDNTSFPTLYNMYSWRGRAKRKRGTSRLGQLTRQIVSVTSITNPWELGTIAVTGGFINLFQYLGLINTVSTITGITNATQAIISIVGPPFAIGDIIYIAGVAGMTGINGLYFTVINVGVNSVTINLDTTSSGAYGGGGQAYLISNPSLQPGQLSLLIGADTYTDPDKDGTIFKNGILDPGSNINYASGTIFITGVGTTTATGTFAYYPGLPVMGLEDFDDNTTTLYPVALDFDTKYSYQIDQTVSPPNFYNTTFYKNTNIPFIWNGQDYQQFWTTNYSSALWATNGNPGFHFVQSEYVAGTGTPDITFHFTKGGNDVTYLIDGDVVWFNEWSASTINGLTGTVTDDSGSATGQYVVSFVDADGNPLNVTVAGTGITQLLTNTVQTDTAQDGIRWYDGDPTAHNGIPDNNGFGWVNFAPPLTADPDGVSIDNRPPGLYYLVGALAILPFKDRLLFFKPIIQTSTGPAITLQDTVLWSWNGTPYYNDILPKDNDDPQTFNAIAYYVDQTGAGGYQPAGISNPIVTVSSNEDVLLIGFGGDGRKTRFVYTGNDLQPFLFFNINNELPSSATFSAVSLDKGVIDIGQYGIAITDQQSSQRVDLEIPDEVFTIQSLNNGVQRINAIRDFFREWIYFTYPVSNSRWKFPTQTFLYNYRDVTWAILYENYTRHGNYRQQTKNTWATIGEKFGSWSAWREPWNSGANSALFTSVVAGNPQGYVMITDEGTGEGPSGTISAIQYNNGDTQITSIDHCVSQSNPNLPLVVINGVPTNQGDFVYITGALGLLFYPITNIVKGTTTVVTSSTTYLVGQMVMIDQVSGMTELNGNTYVIIAVDATTITLDVDSTLFHDYTSGGIAEVSFNKRVGKVISVIDKDNFVVDIPYPASTYLGLGKFSRLSQPLIQTKQFNFYWTEGKKTIIKNQKYLMDTTANSQVTVNIYLSQDEANAWNAPETFPQPGALIFSQVLYTCPESTNIGLTPANTNLQMPAADTQNQIWHRMGTALIGDSFQLGITLNESQMKNITYATSEIGLHAIQFTTDRGPALC